MAESNFTDIEGFNAAPRRERPGLRVAVASALLGAVGFAAWNLLPYVAGVFLVLAP